MKPHTDPGPWLEVEAHFRRETTGGAIGFWTGDMKGLREKWVFIPKDFIRRPNPAPKGEIEIFEIHEKWVIDKGLEGLAVDDGATSAHRETEQGRLL